MNDRPAVIDLDSHLSDASEELWKPYFCGATEHLRPRVVVDSDGERRLLVAERLFPKPRGPGCGSPLGIGASSPVFSIEERLVFIESLNIKKAFITPGFVGFGALTSTDRAARLAIAEAHNRLVQDLTADMDVLEPVPVVSLEDPEWSVEQLERFSGSDVYAVVTRPTTTDPRPFRHAADNSFLEHLVEANVVLYLHTTTGYHQASPVADLFDDYIFTHAFSHPVEMMVALADLLSSGLMAKGLRVAVLEAGCGWLPWFLDRLETHFGNTGGLSIALSPREQALQSLLMGVYPDDIGIPLVTETLGDDVLGFMSDYPHWDAAKGETIDSMIASLGSERSHKILYANAARVMLGKETGLEARS